jgi:D-serine dehydratase
MEKILFEGKNIQQWIEDYPLLNEIINTNEVFWSNPDYRIAKNLDILKAEDINDAAKRLDRFASYIGKVFPETAEASGIIESPLISIPKMQKLMEQKYDSKIKGSLLLKCDSHLPISGSIKARGGIYEVLKHAEKLAIEHKMLTYSTNYEVLDNDQFKELFSRYSIAVGSTGNLGLSIGIMSAQLGFKVTVHMSADAKQWKKDLLRSKGVIVIEYQSDYSKAVEEGRKQALSDPTCYFIDDENSSDLFLGYAVAASRLKKQLVDMKITVDEDHPLFVYLPCGVGGGPGGITFGLKAAFGEHVHCFFAEPTHSPCFLIGQLTRLHDKVSVQDFGLDNMTDADGLAVGRASSFVGKTIGHLLSGCYTIQDERLYSFLSDLVDTENIFLEPSALAGFYGPLQLLSQPDGHNYIKENNIQENMENAHHIVWGTGGSMVPKEVMEQYYKKGTN